MNIPDIAGIHETARSGALSVDYRSYSNPYRSGSYYQPRSASSYSNTYNNYYRNYNSGSSYGSRSSYNSNNHYDYFKKQQQRNDAYFRQMIKRQRQNSEQIHRDLIKSMNESQRQYEEGQRRQNAYNVLRNNPPQSLDKTKKASNATRVTNDYKFDYKFSWEED